MGNNVAAKTSEQQTPTFPSNANYENDGKGVDSPSTPLVGPPRFPVEHLGDPNSEGSVLEPPEMRDVLQNEPKEGREEGAKAAMGETMESPSPAAKQEILIHPGEPVTTTEPSQLSVNVPAPHQPVNALPGGAVGEKKKRGPMRGPLHKLMKGLRKAF
jgi:hypothetical protein